MLPQATENVVAGHIWPAGSYLPTPELGLYFFLIRKTLYTVGYIIITNKRVSKVDPDHARMKRIP